MERSDRFDIEFDLNLNHVEHLFFNFSNTKASLVSNVTVPGKVDGVREASLEALGYICQDIVCVNEQLIFELSCLIFLFSFEQKRIRMCLFRKAMLF